MKTKINFVSKKMLSLLIAGVTLMLSGCNTNQNKKNYSENPITENIIEENDIYAAYFDYSDSVLVEYGYDEYYPTSEQVEAEYYKYKNDSSCPYEFEGDLYSFCKQIEENSKSFIEDNKSYTVNDSEIKLKDAFGDCYNMLSCIDLKNILDTMEENSDNFSEDLCSMQDLKIVYSEELNVEGIFLDKNNLIMINPTNHKHDEIIDILSHELRHRMQVSCSHRNFKKITTVDIEHVSFIEEASAESYLYNIKKRNSLHDKDYTYLYERRDESIILLLALFNENVTITDYYNALADSDLDKFYNFFNVNTEEERLRLNKILYSLDTNSRRSSLVNDKVMEEGSFGLEDCAYLTDIFKIVLKDMMNYTISHENFSLDENIIMFDIVKNVLTCSSETYENYEYVQKIFALEQNYISFLAAYYTNTTIQDYSIEDIREKEIELSNKVDEIFKCIEENPNCYLISKYKEKFPLLDAVVYPSSKYLNHDIYDFFLKQNNVSLKKVKKYN